jgi:hypothetical protein
MYSRYFGIGMVRIMDIVGIEMDKDEVYPIMEDWMKTKLGKSHLSACVSFALLLEGAASLSFHLYLTLLHAFEL